MEYSASTASKNSIKLTSEENYLTWGTWAISTFHHERLLADLSPKLAFYPPQATETLKNEKLYWEFKIQKETAAYLRELKGLQRPQQDKYEIPALTDPSADANAKKAHKTLMQDRKHEYQEDVKAYDLEAKQAFDLLHAHAIDEARVRVWTKIDSSLGEEFRSAIGAVPYGSPHLLAQELEAMVNRNPEMERTKLKLQFWNSSLSVEGQCDLTKWGHYVRQTNLRLVVLGDKEVPTDVAAIYKRGLPEDIFDTFLNKVADDDTLTFEQIATSARAYACRDGVAKKLRELSESYSRTSYKRPAGQVMNIDARRGGGTTNKQPQEDCRNFLNGNCTRGSSCPRNHPPSQKKPTWVCKHYGHTEATCWNLHPELRDRQLSESTRHQNHGKPSQGKPATRTSRTPAEILALYKLAQDTAGDKEGDVLAMFNRLAVAESSDDDEPRQLARLFACSQVAPKYKRRSNNRIADAERCAASDLKTDSRFGDLPLVSRKGRRKTPVNFKTTKTGQNSNPSVQQANCFVCDVASEKVNLLGERVGYPNVSKHVHFSDSVKVQVVAAIRKDQPILDGGSTIHATNLTDLCFDVEPSTMRVAGVTGTPFTCEHQGKLRFLPHGHKSCITLTNVQISKNFPCTFISESLLAQKGCTITKRGSGGFVNDAKGKEVFKVNAVGGLYYALGQILNPTTATPTTTIVDPGHHEEDVDLGDPNFAVVHVARSYSAREMSDVLTRYHRRLSHMDMKRVATAYGIKLPSDFVLPLCDACVIGKASNHPHHEGAKLRASKPCQGLHLDFCGPFPSTSVTGANYLLIFVCDFTDFIWDFYPAKQSEFFTILEELLLRLDNEYGVNVVAWLRSDNGKVFTDKRVTSLCAARGIRQEFSAPYSQFQNGKAERTFDTILNLATAGLHQSGLSEGYWEYSVRNSTLAVNRIGELPTKNTKKGFPAHYSRLERLKNQSIPTQLNGIYPLGVLVYKRVPKEVRKKFEPKAEAALYLTLHPTIKGALLLKMSGNTTTVTASFTVSEGHFPLKLNLTSTPSSQFIKDHGKPDGDTNLPIYWPPAEKGRNVIALRDPRMDSLATSLAATRTPRQWTPSAQNLQNIADAKQDRRITAGSDHEPSVVMAFSPVGGWLQTAEDEEIDRQVAHKFFSTHPMFKMSGIEQPQVPLTRQEFQARTPSTHKRAMSSEDKKYWLWAEKREVSSHFKNGTLGPLLTKLPDGFRKLPTAFVFRNKYNGDESLKPQDLPTSSWKARLVVKGYLMLEGVDFESTFAPTAQPSSVRLLAAIAAQNRLILKTADVETAFLSSEMDMEVYITTPEGYETWAKHGEQGLKDLPFDYLPPDNGGPEPHGFRRLLKGVPGIKQGSRLFYQKANNALISMNYIRHPADPCIYYRYETNHFSILALWVDDIIGAFGSDAEWEYFLGCLSTTFTITDGGNISDFLGMEFKQSCNRTIVTICQRNSVDDLLHRASMEACNPAPTPCVAGFVFTKADCPEVVQPRPLSMPNYRGLLALALFISVWTRVDIVFTVNKLCKFMGNPGEKHVNALKRLCRYLSGTRNCGLVYKLDASISARGLHGYTDSSHMDCIDTSRSTIAFVFYFGSAVISWYSKLHSFVTTCVNHSEYAAMFNGSKEAFYLAKWLSPLENFLLTQTRPVTIFNDNNGANSLAFDPVGRFKNKHVRMEHHYVQELVVQGEILPKHVPSLENTSDLLTKPLGPTEFPLVAARVTGDTSLY